MLTSQPKDTQKIQSSSSTSEIASAPAKFGSGGKVLTSIVGGLLVIGIIWFARSHIPFFASYPSVQGAYSGTESGSLPVSMTLDITSQDQQNISGTCTLGNSSFPFNGTVDTSGNIQFSINASDSSNGNNVTVTFSGNAQNGNGWQGSFSDTDNNQGTWSVGRL